MPDLNPDFFDPAEDCEDRTPRAIFAERGFTPPAPSEVDERQLPGRLWELIHAAAARRLFFCFTNHLSDRDFLTLLHERWLDEPTADFPLESETNTTLFVSEFNANALTHEEIFLRYYADDTFRELCRRDESYAVFPPREKPPFDRDRFLPTPPIPLEAHAGWLPGDDDPAEEKADDEPDPLGLADVDREIAAAKSELATADPSFIPSNPAFEEKLRAMEPENWTPPAKQLTDERIPLLPPAELTDNTLTPMLWELLHNLFLRGFYVLHSDHLSDSELYDELWERGLRDPAMLPGRNPRGGWFHDILGSWGEEEMQIWHRFYATDDERTKHEQECPEDKLPSKEKPPFSRDWRLPKGPF